jgi:rhamnose utilization protein RhaD (predicted bifunctional aldolase and dehydrogenase)
MSVRRGHAGRVDLNQRAIVDAFRACGWSVTILAQVGSGCPDLVIGKGGRNLLVEVKDGKSDLTDDEAKWHGAWRGQVCIVRTVEDVAQLTTEHYLMERIA